MKPIRHIVLAAIALLTGASSAIADGSRSVVAMTLTQSDHGGGRIYLPVRMGNVIGTMRLDTGASTTRIRLAPWNKDFPSLGQSMSTSASGATTACDDVEARNVEIKADQGNNIARAKYEVSRCAAGDGDDLLGLTFFKGARFTLDFDRREMVFFGESLTTSRPRPFRMLGPDQRLVGVELRSGDTTGVGLFDTGAEICAVDRPFMEKHKKLFTLVKTKGKASGAGGKTFSSKIYRIRELDLGDGRVVRGVPALVYDFGVLREALGRQTPIILGYNFLSRFNWELDFKTPNAPSWNARQR